MNEQHRAAIALGLARKPILGRMVARVRVENNPTREVQVIVRHDPLSGDCISVGVLTAIQTHIPYTSTTIQMQTGTPITE
jgi:hypothetical protein